MGFSRSPTRHLQIFSIFYFEKENFIKICIIIFFPLNCFGNLNCKAGHFPRLREWMPSGNLNNIVLIRHLNSLEIERSKTIVRQRCLLMSSWLKFVKLDIMFLLHVVDFVEAELLVFFKKYLLFLIHFLYLKVKKPKTVWKENHLFKSNR